jgi:uncharacterized protein (TIGR02246 family)
MTLDATQLSLEDRIQLLEDYEAIRQVMFRYAAGMDRDFDADAIAELFVEDATWSISPSSSVSGTHSGREAIREFFAGLTREYSWTMHNVGNELITIADDGQSATGTWYLVDPCTMLINGEERAAFITGKYDNAFTKQSGRWYLQRLTARLNQVSSWDKGWIVEPWLVGS